MGTARPEVPWIFLSHSGKQKEFTRRLYQELVRVGHSPFFDQNPDALQKGRHFPADIVDACRRCKMGIVVLSHDYLESLWPMIELEQLTFHNPDSNLLIFPLFYGLQPADLSDASNLRRWQTKWDILTPTSLPIDKPSTSLDFRVTINKSSWPAAVQKLRSRNGEVRPPNMEDDAYIQKIVSSLCSPLPPPQRYRLGDHIQGTVRMQQDIEELFRQQDEQDNGVIALGVHGVGGSGKTTLCLNMANHFNKDFPGRSCSLEFPSDQENEKQLVKAIKNVLRKIAGTNNEKKISSLPEAMGSLEEILTQHRVFLAIDNVWNWNLSNARQIVREMKYISGSRVMVTSRSKEMLQRLQLTEVLYVPSITREEAAEALYNYSYASSFPRVVSREYLRNLARFCFYEERCHPLLLKAVGDRLKEVGNDSTAWEEVISELRAFPTAHGDTVEQSDEVEESVLKVLEKTFLAIPTKLQKIFIDLVTSVPRTSVYFQESLNKWMSMLHDGFSKTELARLEYHGLLEQNKGAIYVHDLHKLVARRHLSKNRDAAYHYLFEGNLSQCQKKNLKYAIGETGWPVDHISDLAIFKRLELVNCFRDLEILYVYDAHKVQWLSVSGMGSLRYLKIQGCGDLKDIDGWQGAPNLVSLNLDGCFDLRNLGGIGCLHKLQELSIRRCNNLQTFPDDANLRRLRILDLSGCDNLVSIGGRESALTSLEELCLVGCSRLQRIPDLKSLAQLKVLKASSCRSLREVTLGVSSLTSLQVCDLKGCESLEWSPDVRGGVTCAVKVEELLLGRLRFQCQLQTREPTMSAFVGLQKLVLSCRNYDIFSLDVSGIVSLEFFYLYKFPSLQDFIIGQGTLTQLQELRLFYLSSLKSLPDLQQLTSLRKIYLKNLLSLRSLHSALPASLVLLHMEYCTSLRSLPPDLPASLRALVLVGCSSLENLPPDLPASLVQLCLGSCSSLRSLPYLPASIRDLQLQECTSLTDVSGLTSLTSLQKLDLSKCSSLEDIPDLSHNTALYIYGLQSCPADPAWRYSTNWRTREGYVYRSCPGGTLGYKERGSRPVGKLDCHFHKLMRE